LRKRIVVAAVIALLIGGLLAAQHKHAPTKPPPSREEIWAAKGVPVSTDRAFTGKMDILAEVTGDINALRKTILSSKVPGRVIRVYAYEGDSVTQGQTVILLDQQDALSNLQQATAGLETALARLEQAKTNAEVTRIQTQAAIDQAEASLKSAKARYAVVKNPARTQERTVAENNVASAKANLDNAEANFERHAKLLKEGAISQSLYDIADAQYKVAKAQYESAKESLSLLKEGGRSEDLAQAQAAIDVAQEQLRLAKANASQNLIRRQDVKSAAAAVSQARAAVALAKQQLDNTYIRSQISGRLASRQAEPGQVVSPGQPLGEVVDLNSLYFKGNVSEMELAGVVKGLPVKVRIDALKNETFSGVVSEVFPAGSTLSRNFPVRIRITDKDKRIKPGMFARGSIRVGNVTNALLVPKDAVDERRGTYLVFTLGKKRDPKGKIIDVARRHEVTILREDDKYAQIARPTDIKPGDVVITMGRQNLQDGVKVKIRSGPASLDRR